MGKLNLLSANVRGLNTDEKRRKIYSWLHESKIDIAFLQETHFIQKTESRVVDTDFMSKVNYTILVGKGNHFIRTANRFLVGVCQFILEKTLMLKLSM